MKRIRLGDLDLDQGAPLPCDIYDANGRLLLNAGYVVQSADQFARLLERGAYGAEHELAAARGDAAAGEVAQRRTDVSVLSWIVQARAELDALLADPAAATGFSRAVLDIAAIIHQACAIDGDAALATVLVGERGRYPIRHCVNAAVMAETMNRQIEPDVERRLAATAAALTMNVAMLELQEALYSQQAPLTAEQKAAIVRHPAAGVERLRSLGVEDPVWLDAVAQHHEMIDGSGYPGRLAGDALGVPGRVLALCDRYCATVSERSYRPGALPNVALRQLFLRKETFDATLAALLVKEVGIYPPGTLVKLANGDTAIVVKRTLNAREPMVRGLVGAHGKRLDGYPKRSTHRPMFAIADVLSAASLRFELPVEALWCLSTLTVDDDEDIEGGSAGTDRGVHEQAAT